MTGFEIIVKGKVFPMSASVLMIVISVLKDGKPIISAGGTDNGKFEDLELYESELHENDTILIEVKDIAQSMTPAKRQPVDRIKLLEKYHSLKQELKNAAIL
jgi:hypothetical protein